MSKITDTVSRLVQPIIEQEGCTLWDVEYVKEAGSYYLRVFIDKESGVSIDDCERISRALDPVLDEADPIPDSYIFEVGSAGVERELKRPSDFEQFMGSEVEIKTYRPIDKQKAFVGILKAYEENAITITVGSADRRIEKADIAMVKLHVSF